MIVDPVDFLNSQQISVMKWELAKVPTLRTFIPSNWIDLCKICCC
jgi:hypothetical protein